MGVPKGRAMGEVLALLECRECGLEYETDETMTNDCPNCGLVNFDIVSGAPSDWREKER